MPSSTGRPALLFNHVHVSERESAHHWPDGQFDDAAWEDCTFCANVMLARLCFDADIPHTHLEEEHLRDDAGEPPLGGTSTDDAIRGLNNRYGWKPMRYSGTNVLTMPVGSAAAVQGSMSAFPYSHRLRRWQRDFNGSHDVLIVRISTSVWWWDDPLAPVGSYQGEYVTADEIRRYINALPFLSASSVSKLLPAVTEPDLSVDPVGHVRVVKGGSWWDYHVAGNPTKGYDATVRVSRTSKDGFSAETGKIIEASWGGHDHKWARIMSGVYIKRWIDLHEGPSVIELP